MWAVTTLDRLQIQGIRSYGASEPAQVISVTCVALFFSLVESCGFAGSQNIDFKPPLTLILGANGSGKTT
eukprot:3557257-Rhodomonas_salina.1